jgi:hypothetical protein
MYYLKTMIDKVLLLITSQLNQYIQPIVGGDEVVMGNIALNDSPDQNVLKDKVVVSVVNIEEESTLKNSSHHSKQQNSLSYKNTPVFLNLYVLFCAHYPGSYETALGRLSRVIEFFQHRSSFDINSSQPLPPGFDPSNLRDAELAITLDLFTMTFEQVNHLWGSLGGKQMPFALYKVRLAIIYRDLVIKEVPLIQEIRKEKSII